MRVELDPELLVARIEMLERRLTWLWRAAVTTVVALALGVAGLLAGRPVVAAQSRGGVPAEIVASSFKLVDAAGRPRGILHVDANKVAGLALYDPSGHPRVLLNTDGESTKLAMVGTAEGFPRMTIGQQGDFQMINMEDAKTSFVSILHPPAGLPTFKFGSGEMTGEFGVGEVFARGAKPTRAPTMVLKDGDRTLAELPARPARPPAR
jgi:hypothetical protein